MRILIITPEYLPHPGGIATYYQALAKCLHDAGENITLAYFETQQSKGTPHSCEFHTINLTRERSRLQAAADRCFPPDHPLIRSVLATGLTARGWLRKAGGTSSYDLVVTSDFLGLGMFLNDPEFPPLLVTAHGTLGQMQYFTPTTRTTPDRQSVQTWEILGLQYADLIHAYSPANTAFWQNRGYAHAVFTRPPWVFSQDPVAPIHASRSPYILCAGRLQTWKGPEQVLRALRHIPESAGLPEIHWYGGDTRDPTTDEPLSQRLAREYPESWGTRFLWRQPVPREELKQLRAQSFACLVPSLWDTLNFTALEALDSATPLVLSTLAGASYLIDDGLSGFTFTPDDGGRSLAETLQRLLALNEKDRQNLGHVGRESLYKQLAPESVHKDFIQAAHLAIENRQKRNSDTHPVADTGAAWAICLQHFDRAGWKQNHSLREWLSALREEVVGRIKKR